MASLISGAVSLSAARDGWAQTAPVPNGITLAEAMRMAVGRNPALAGNFVDVDIADARVLAARGLDDFVIDASGTWTHTRADNTPAQATSFSPYDLVDLAASLTRPFSTGGTVALKLDVPYIRRGYAGDSTASAVGPTEAIQGYIPSVQLALTQPLLRGRGYDVARAKIRQANADRGVASRQLVAQASIVLRDVARAYWELAFATGQLALRRDALEATREQLRAVMAQIDVGKQSPSGSAEVEVNVALRQEELVDAERELTERSADFGRLLGVEAIAPAFRTIDAPAVLAPSGEDLLARALAENGEIAALHAQATAASIDVDVAENALLPAFNLVASGGALGIAADAKEAFSNMVNFGGYTMQAGFVFQEPVERRGQRGARDEALERMHKARLAETEARTRVASEVAAAMAALDATQQRAAVLAHAVEVADLDLAGEKARFQANRSTNFDVLRRQQTATEVRLRLLRAEADNAKSAASLDALTTDILSRHRIVLRGAPPHPSPPPAREGDRRAR